MSENKISSIVHEAPDFSLEFVAPLPPVGTKKCSACEECKPLEDFSRTYTKCKACEKIRTLSRIKQLLAEGIPPEFMEGLTYEMLSIFDADGTSPISDDENYKNGRRPQYIRYYTDLIIYVENAKSDSRRSARIGHYKACETPNHIIAKSYVFAGGKCRFPGCNRKPGPRSRERLVMDHDHDTGIFRGFLCQFHNGLLGKLGDNIAGVLRCLKYLLNNEGEYKIAVDHESQLLVQPGLEGCGLNDWR